MSERLATAAFTPPTIDELSPFVQEFAQAPVDIRLYSQGNHCLIYTCQTDGGEPFVARVPKCPSSVRTLLRETPIRIESLGGLPAPQVLHFGRIATNGSPVVLEEYVDGRTQELNTLREAQIVTLAKTISSVHCRLSDQYSALSGTRATARGTHLDYLQSTIQESIVDRLEPIDLTPYPQARMLLDKGQRHLDNLLLARASLFRGTTFSLLHHDLNQGNILWRTDGSVSLIDWNVTRGDPADDIDYLSTDNHAGTQFRQQFLHEYRPPEEVGDVQGRLGAYTLKNLLDHVAWTIQMQEEQSSRRLIYAKAYAQATYALEKHLDIVS